MMKADRLTASRSIAALMALAANIEGAGRNLSLAAFETDGRKGVPALQQNFNFINGNLTDGPTPGLSGTCVYIPLVTGNTSFCGITDTWTPHVASHAVWLVPTGCAVLLTFIVYFCFKKVCYKDKLRRGASKEKMEMMEPAWHVMRKKLKRVSDEKEPPEAEAEPESDEERGMMVAAEIFRDKEEPPEAKSEPSPEPESDEERGIIYSEAEDSDEDQFFAAAPGASGATPSYEAERGMPTTTTKAVAYVAVLFGSWTWKAPFCGKPEHCCGWECCPKVPCFSVGDANYLLKLRLLGKLAGECVDVGMDAYYFLDLESLDRNFNRHIYRNANVLNAIYAFAWMGLLKIPIIVWLAARKKQKVDNAQRRHPSPSRNDPMKTDWVFFGFMLVNFLFQDCPESFLEYFYGEKYSIGEDYAAYMMAKDCVFLVPYLFTGMKVFKRFKHFFDNVPHDKRIASDWGRGAMVVLCSVPFMLVPVAMMIRASSTLYHIRRGKLDEGCLAVVNGRLVQNPFAATCLRSWEMAFIACNFLPCLLMPVVTVACYLRYGKE